MGGYFYAKRPLRDTHKGPPLGARALPTVSSYSVQIFYHRITYTKLHRPTGTLPIAVALDNLATLS